MNRYTEGGKKKLIRDDRGYPAQAHDLYRMLGVKELPVEGMPARDIQGFQVYVRPLPNRDVRRNFIGLRVIAICDCGKHVPVGRLHQHKCKVQP